MKNALAIILALILVLVMAAGCGGESTGSAGSIDIVVETPSDEGDTAGNDAYDGPLVGTWSDIESGFHGNAGYYWAFGNDGRFAYLFSGYEPPQGGGDIDSSVRERFMQGKFRENGSTIECYDIKVDDYFAWGDNWRYFPDRDPAILAKTLLATSLIEPEKIDDFSIDFELSDTMVLHLVVDLGDFPDQYDMDFEYIE